MEAPMFEEARLPLIDPLSEEYEEEFNKTKKEDEKKERVMVLEISPKDHNAIDL
jgi:hypothetical protein